jgi:hypothetical protein
MAGGRAPSLKVSRGACDSESGADPACARGSLCHRAESTDVNHAPGRLLASFERQIRSFSHELRSLPCASQAPQRLVLLQQPVAQARNGGWRGIAHPWSARLPPSGLPLLKPPPCRCLQGPVFSVMQSRRVDEVSRATLLLWLAPVLGLLTV